MLARALCGTIVVLLGSALVHVAQVRRACGLECAVGFACLLWVLAEQLADWDPGRHFARVAHHLTSGCQPNSPALDPPPCTPLSIDQSVTSPFVPAAWPPCVCPNPQGLDRLFEGHSTLLLFTVMVCCPLLMNLCQVRAGGVGCIS